MVAAENLPPPPFSIESVDAAKALLEVSKKGRAANLVKHTAADLEEPGTQPITAKLPLNDVAWLKSLPEGASYHIRQAVKVYRKNTEKMTNKILISIDLLSIKPNPTYGQSTISIITNQRLELKTMLPIDCSLSGDCDRFIDCLKLKSVNETYDRSGVEPFPLKDCTYIYCWCGTAPAIEEMNTLATLGKVSISKDTQTFANSQQHQKYLFSYNRGEYSCPHCGNFHAVSDYSSDNYDDCEYQCPSCGNEIELEYEQLSEEIIGQLR